MAAAAGVIAAACGGAGGDAERVAGSGGTAADRDARAAPAPPLVARGFDLSVYRELAPDTEHDVNPRALFQALWRDAIPPVYDPEIVGADEAGLSLHELVIGIEINGEARAYPVGVMREREIANDKLGGIPIVVTW